MTGGEPDRDSVDVPRAQAGDRPFVWPPRTPGPAGESTNQLVASDPVAHKASPPQTSTALSPLAAAIAHIERTWLGLISPPWPTRIAEASWRPDTPDDYCWRCGARAGPFEVTPPESPEPGCSDCRSTRPSWSRFIRLGDYSGLLREAIHEMKFARWRQLGLSLGRQLGHAIREQMDWAKVDPDHLWLIPVPASFLRRFTRGIDHTLVLAQGAREITGGRILRPISRLHRPSQLQVPPSQRSRNVAGSFKPRRPPAAWKREASMPVESPAPTLVLIDDVKTTGATMTAACRAVLTSWRSSHEIPNIQRPSVWAAVVGVTPKPGNAPGGPEIPDTLAEFSG